MGHVTRDVKTLTHNFSPDSVKRMPPGIPKHGYHNNNKVDLCRRIDDDYQT